MNFVTKTCRWLQIVLFQHEFITRCTYYKKMDTVWVAISSGGLSFYSKQTVWTITIFMIFSFTGLPGDICWYSTCMESSWVDSSIWKVPWCYWCSSCESSIYFAVYASSYCILFSYLSSSKSYHFRFWYMRLVYVPKCLLTLITSFCISKWYFLFFSFIYLTSFSWEKEWAGYFKYYN